MLFRVVYVMNETDESMNWVDGMKEFYRQTLVKRWRKVVVGGVAAFTAALLLSGCATNPTAPDGSEQKGDTGQQDAHAYEYIIGPGDSLDIFVWGYEDLTVTLPVRPDGRITTRLVEDMQAAGKTSTELARDIEGAYRGYVKNPTVSVTVSEFVGSPAQQIKVVGGGAKPKTVPYKNSMTLLDLMIEVGGLGEFASGNRATLVRSANGKRESFKVRLNDLLSKGDISANVPLFPGDIIIIPESWF